MNRAADPAPSIVAEREASPLAASPQHTDYRADIDGLRAVAVLSVVGFHAFPLWLHGGFVGVDVFFVISGYLISSIIYNALRVGRFSYLEFYIRRVRRIFPALLVVLAVCLLAGWALLLPDEYKQLGRQVAAGAGFGANILFWSQAGYFDTDAAIKPLLHLWSLGIEEQFYLVWPLLLAWLYPRTRRLGAWIVVLLTASFVVNVVWVWDRPSATFYLPMSRFWELLSGALLAYWVMFVRAAPAGGAGEGRVREWLSWCGVLLLGVSVLLIDEQRAFPGYWALLPVCGTLCLISAGGSWVNRRVLGHRAVVFVGLISYPLYLWHWVLLALLRMRLYEDGAEAPRGQRAVAVVVAVLLAWGTYRFIEKPIRFGRAGSRWVLWRPAGLVGLLAVVALLGVAVDLSDGVAQRYPAEIRPLAAFQYDKARRYYSGVLDGRICFNEDPNDTSPRLGAQCVEPPNGRTKLLLLWGDSHAAALYPGLKALQAQHPEYRLAQFTMGACPPMLNWDSERRPQCRHFNDVAIAKIGTLHPDVVVLEGDWQYYLPEENRSEADLAPLVAAIAELQRLRVPRIVVIGNLPVWKFPAPRVATKLWLETHKLPLRSLRHLDPDSMRADELVRKALSTQRVSFVSPIDQLCNAEGCLLTTNARQWTPLAWDAAHLTTDGSTYLMERFAPSIFPE